MVEGLHPPTIIAVMAFLSALLVIFGLFINFMLDPIKKDIARLEAGQARFDERLKNLETGQARFDKRLEKLEAGQAGLSDKLDRLLEKSA